MKGSANSPKSICLSDVVSVCHSLESVRMDLSSENNNGSNYDNMSSIQSISESSSPVSGTSYLSGSTLKLDSICSDMVISPRESPSSPSCIDFLSVRGDFHLPLNGHPTLGHPNLTLVAELLIQRMRTTKTDRICWISSMGLR